MTKCIRFSEIEKGIKKEVPPKPGVYEIWTDCGISLKVGISKDIRKRLLQHRASRQSGLKLKPNFEEADRINPNNVQSKSSILAKHLYYDQTLAKKYKLDFKKENDRRKFLLENCYIIFEITETRENAREIERKCERNEQFRYIGRVIIR